MSEKTGIVQAVCDCLTQRGITARPAWTGQLRESLTAPAVYVGIRRYAAVPGGFEHYLGERYDADSAAWQEFYGKKVELTLGLDLYAGERADGESLQELLEKLVQVLTLQPPEGLQVGELTCGETVWDEKHRRVKREVSAQCTAWLQAVSSEAGGAFLDFELRGGWKI